MFPESHAHAEVLGALEGSRPRVVPDVNEVHRLRLPLEAALSGLLLVELCLPVRLNLVRPAVERVESAVREIGDSGEPLLEGGSRVESPAAAGEKVHKEVLEGGGGRGGRRRRIRGGFGGLRGSKEG